MSRMFRMQRKDGVRIPDQCMVRRWKKLKWEELQAAGYYWIVEEAAKLGSLNSTCHPTEDHWGMLMRTVTSSNGNQVFKGRWYFRGQMGTINCNMAITRLSPWQVDRPKQRMCVCFSFSLSQSVWLSHIIFFTVWAHNVYRTNENLPALVWVLYYSADLKFWYKQHHWGF